MLKKENKYKKALTARIREEAAAEKRQEKLRKRYGVPEGVSVSETKPGHTVLSVLRILLFAAAAVLSFVFLLVLLDPQMRRMFFDMPPFDRLRWFT